MTDNKIEITRIGAETLAIPIRGTAPLIVHRFAEKAKATMLDAMQGRRTPRTPKDPEAEYQAAIYRLKDGTGYGFPAVAFKAATVGAARFYGKDVTMTGLRQYLFFRGEPGDDGQLMVRIEGEPVMREDVVRVGQGTDLRYRPQFTDWSAVLQVTFVRSALTRESVVSLVDAGGMGVGVGEWRPEKRGDFGTYEVDQTRDVEVLS
jgi:hypothetical protein